MQSYPSLFCFANYETFVNLLSEKEGVKKLYGSQSFCLRPPSLDILKVKVTETEWVGPHASHPE